jgi:hypothetical protein
LSEDATQLTNFTVVFRQQPKLSVGNHFGGGWCSTAKDICLSVWARNNQRATAQDLSKLGKVVRLTETGTCRRIIPLSAGLTPAGDLGLRHPQSAGHGDEPWSDALWLNEHGPRGGMKLISRRRGKTTAGRWRRTALTTAACPSGSKGQNGSGNRASPVCLAGLPGVSGMAFTRRRPFPSGSISCLSAR